jgi:hypothetical protein
MRRSFQLAIALVWLLLAGQAAVASPVEGESLSIALEAPASSRVRDPGDVFERVEALLTARGHTVTILAGPDLNTPAKIGAYDVVVLNGSGFGASYDWEIFEANVEGYVEAGGGLVSTGWATHLMVSAPSAPYPGIEAVLPFAKGTVWTTFGTVTPVPGHPITDGLSSFLNPDQDNHGGGVKPGATVLMQNDLINDGAAWNFGSGRVVYLGPIFLAEWNNYDNEPLLDGSTPDAQELFLRSVEWAGGASLSSTEVSFARVIRPGVATVIDPP